MKTFMNLRTIILFLGKKENLFHKFTCGLLLPELGLIANDVKMKYAIVTTEMMQLNCNGSFV